MSQAPKKRQPELPADLARRVWIANVQPRVDGGRFPVKRSVGQKIVVTADIFADGHDALGAVVRHRRAAAEQWAETPMKPLGNDVWQGEFSVPDMEPHEFSVAGWVDRFGSWRDELRKKSEAGQDVASELLEGAALVKEASGRAPEPDRRWLGEVAALLARKTSPQAERVERALAQDLRVCMARHPDRSRQTVHEPAIPVEVTRERARHGAWYEMFPRSAGPDPERGATFREAEARLAEIARMGFDVLYLPPIHPIGRTHRKGPNNTLAAPPGAPGSPWAIGAAEGGHTAVHPDLGTLEDFDHFVAAAGKQDLEVALDIAFQCSPDHPWVKQHPEWFRHRPDGSIKYAENPPKKYQDIYPLDFDGEAWRDLWSALHDVFQFWVDRGVRIFRVDNPHTKPLRFWQWVIGRIKERHPDVVFLSEAFTRPKVMYTLAKVGFDQSYTYFTWRNTKPEITGYMTELTRTGVREFFRPNLFANTPDILPAYLQFGGRPAFQARLVLAATLGASYGIYSGFELCEAQAIQGTEEYMDSEKFEIRRRQWDAPGNIRDFIAKVNRIRRENPALAYNERLEFHPTDNEQILFYSKTTEDLSNIILVVVNLDPHHVHHGWVEVPIEKLGIEAGETYQVHDLIGEGRYLWHGSRNYVHLEPSASPAQIFRLRRRVRSEKDFDYFM